MDVGARGDASTSALDFFGVFQVGVKILAVFDSCFVDSVRVFFSIGGGRDDPLLLPFSSSTVGADGGSVARLDWSTVGVSPPTPDALASSSPMTAASSRFISVGEAGRAAICKVGKNLLERGDDVGVVLMVESF